MARVFSFYAVLIVILFSCSAGSDRQTDEITEETEKSLIDIHKPAVINSQDEETVRKYQRIVMDVELDPQLSEYSVNQRIYYTNNYDHPLDELCFRTFMGTDPGFLNLRSYHVSGRQTTLVNIRSSDFFCIEFPGQIDPGDRVEIMLSYSASIPEKKPENARLFAFHDNCLMFDYFYPSLMVYGKNGWDLSEALRYGDLIYNEATLFEVNLTRPGNFIYASTGNVTASEKSEGSDLVTDSIVTGPARSFFLAGGFDWIKYSEESGETVISVFGDARYAGRLEKALPVVKKALETMSSVICPYPYTEFDAAFIPAGWSAMEYPGVIAVGRYFLGNLPPGYNAVSFRNAELIIVHETIHQWFFNLVGNDQINEAWLDEAFTQYMTKYYFQKIYGNEKAGQYIQFLENTAGDAVRENLPVNLSAGSYKNGSEYTKAVYGRAPLFFHELEQKFGETKFLEFVKWYQEKYRWKIADTVRFLDDLDEFFGENTAGLFADYFKFE